jgi:hypothetical protein
MISNDDINRTPNSSCVLRYPNLFLALGLLADDNGLVLRVDISIPNHWRVRADTAERQASEMRDKPVGYYMSVEQERDVEADDDALEYVANGESTIVDKLVEAAKCQELHQFLNQAFDGDLHASIFLSGRARHAR